MCVCLFAFPPPRQFVYTFGSPRVGNRPFANLVDAKVPNHYRVVFDGDIVAGIPKMLWMYKHAGTEVRVRVCVHVTHAL